jgi:nitroreductase/NAD-dependent dihydropyrimidine dehydrogenase PreA subunit
MVDILFDAEKCIRCGACVAACPASVFVQGKDDVPEVVREALCIACGHCVAVCPVDAVTHSAFPDGTVIPVDSDLLPSAEQMLELLRSRRSVRVFKDKPVSPEELEQILEAARVAPTGHNAQDVRYVVVQDRALLDAITKSVVRYFTGVAKQLRNPVVRKLYRLAVTRSEIDGIANMLPDFDAIKKGYSEGQDPILRGAPCVILAHSPRTVNFPETNAALALHNAALLAHSMNIGSFWTGYVVGACKRNRKIPDLLGIPKGHEVYAGLAVGYPDVTYQKWIQRRVTEVIWK